MKQEIARIDAFPKMIEYEKFLDCSPKIIDNFIHTGILILRIERGGIAMVIQRKEYLDKLIAFKDKQLIKVVTGIRRCGKSTLLEIYQSWLLEHGTEKDQIISINFEDIDFEELTDYRRLYSYLKERLVSGK